MSGRAGVVEEKVKVNLEGDPEIAEVSRGIDPD